MSNIKDIMFGVFMLSMVILSTIDRRDYTRNLDETRVEYITSIKEVIGGLKEVNMKLDQVLIKIGGE